MKKYQCACSESGDGLRLCDDLGEPSSMKCSECSYGYVLQADDELLDLFQKKYPEVKVLEECEPNNLLRPVCRVAISDDDITCLVREFEVAGFDKNGEAVFCIVDQADRRFWL